MDWKKIIKDEIAEYQENLIGRDQLEERIWICQEEKVSIKSAKAEAVATRGGSNRHDDRIVGLIVEEDMAREQLAIINNRIKLVEAGLSRLTDEERDILLTMSAAKYGDGNVERLCEKYTIERATVYRLWKQASKKYKGVQFGHT